MRQKSKIDSVQRQEMKDSLRILGFTYYWEYLKSDLWNRIRNKVLVRDDHKCKFCNEKATAVHHTSYASDVMSGRNLIHLHSVCRKCHNSGHKKNTATKPDRFSICPNCKKEDLRGLDKKTNKFGKMCEKTVCKLCRRKAHNRYKESIGESKKKNVSTVEYQALPPEFKYNVSNFFLKKH